MSKILKTHEDKVAERISYRETAEWCIEDDEYMALDPKVVIGFIDRIALLEKELDQLKSENERLRSLLQTGARIGEHFGL